ncbi:MAG: TolA-binding protein, partial [Myxococcota bacterium]
MPWVFRVCLVVGLVSACATTVPQDKAPLPTDHIELDPLVLKAGKTGVVALQARPLFKSATKDYSSARYDDALDKFLVVIENFPTSKYAQHAHFNAGLAAMRLERWEDALGHHERARKALGGTSDEWDALLQITHCLEKLARWKELRLSAHELLTRGKVNVTARVEVRARLGIARYQMGELALAERAFKRVLNDYKKNISVPALERNPYVSQAQYLIGEIYGGLFAS